MWYIIIRILFGAILLCGFFLWLRKCKSIKKKVISISSIVIISILISLSALVPVENIFISFSSAQDAFTYCQTGEIDEIVEGKESTMVLFSNGNSNSMCIFPKTKNGWKIGTFFSYETIFSMVVDKKIVDVYRTKGTDDCYVLIYDYFSSELGNISDSKHSKFLHNIKKINNLDQLQIKYFTYVGHLDENYTLFINGVPIEIK